MLHELKIYAAYLLQALKVRMSYKLDFIVLVCSSIFTLLSGFLMIFFLMDGDVVQSLGGWSRDQILLIYGVSSLSSSFFSVVAPNLYSFGDRFIAQAQYDRVLLRPINSLGQVLFESFNLESLGSVFVGLGMIFYSSYRLGLEFSLLDYTWLLITAVSGGIIIISVFVIVASFSFHFEDRIGIAPPVFNLMMFSRYPTTIFNSLVQILLSWIFPFAFAGFFPATHFLRKSEYAWYCYATPLMAVACLGIAQVFWKYGESKYSSTGS